jgi:hypothetical protein
MMGQMCGLTNEDRAYTHNFFVENFWKAVIWKTEQEMWIIKLRSLIWKQVESFGRN